MTIEEVSVGQRVRFVRFGGSNRDEPGNGTRDGSVVAINWSEREVEVSIAEGAVASHVTVSPELLEPVDSGWLADAGGEPLARKRWWERVAEAGASIPAEERVEIPRDASENLDFYLYGWEKKRA